MYKEVKKRRLQDYVVEKYYLCDIDILLWEDLVLHDEELTIPHRRMYGRKFMLLPLLEVVTDKNLFKWLAETIPDQEIRAFEEVAV